MNDYISTILVVVVISGFYVTLWKLQALHILVNSRLSSLLEITAKSSHAAGMEQERQDEMTRQADATK